MMDDTRTLICNLKKVLPFINVNDFANILNRSDITDDEKIKQALTQYFKQKSSNLFYNEHSIRSEAENIHQLFPNTTYTSILRKLEVFKDMPDRKEIILRIILSHNVFKDKANCTITRPPETITDDAENNNVPLVNDFPLIPTLKLKLKRPVNNNFPDSLFDVSAPLQTKRLCGKFDINGASEALSMGNIPLENKQLQDMPDLENGLSEANSNGPLDIVPHPVFDNPAPVHSELPNVPDLEDKRNEIISKSDLPDTKDSTNQDLKPVKIECNIVTNGEHDISNNDVEPQVPLSDDLVAKPQQNGDVAVENKVKEQNDVVIKNENDVNSSISDTISSSVDELLDTIQRLRDLNSMSSSRLLNQKQAVEATVPAEDGLKIAEGLEVTVTPPVVKEETVVKTEPDNIAENVIIPNGPDLANLPSTSTGIIGNQYNQGSDNFDLVEYLHEFTNAPRYYIVNLCSKWNIELWSQERPPQDMLSNLIDKILNYRSNSGNSDSEPEQEEKLLQTFIKHHSSSKTVTLPTTPPIPPIKLRVVKTNSADTNNQTYEVKPSLPSPHSSPTAASISNETALPTNTYNYARPPPSNTYQRSLPSSSNAVPPPSNTRQRTLPSSSNAVPPPTKTYDYGRHPSSASFYVPSTSNGPAPPSNTYVRLRSNVYVPSTSNGTPLPSNTYVRLPASTPSETPNTPTLRPIPAHQSSSYVVLPPSTFPEAPNPPIVRHTPPQATSYVLPPPSTSGRLPENPPITKIKIPSNSQKPASKAKTVKSSAGMETVGTNVNIPDTPPPAKKQKLAEVNNQLVNYLCGIFPDAAPEYIRPLCAGQPMTDAIVDEITTTILNTNGEYPKRPVVEAEPEVMPENQLEILKELLPDADPDYLQMMCDKFEGKPDEVKTFINDAMEHRKYPTLKDYQRRQQLSAQQKQYTTDFTVENFIKVIPDPEACFSDKSRIIKMDNLSQHYALTFLCNSFNRLPKRVIQAMFAQNNYKLFATFKGLQECMKEPGLVMKSVRKATVMPNSVENIPLLQEIAYITHEKEIADYANKTKEKEESEKQEALQLGLLKTCNCCYDEEVLPKHIFCCENSCAFCKSCIQKSTEVRFGEGKLDFPCLLNCGSNFTLQILQAALSPKLFSKIAQKKALEEIKTAGIDGLEYCPFCDFATIPAEGYNIFTCMNPECMKESCRLCKEPSHIPLRCDEIEKDADVKARVFVENKMTEALLRKCWKCGVKFFKEEGCNKMTCSCGAQMCYICGDKVTSYKHFNGNGGDRFDLCPLYSDTNSLNKENVLKGAAEAKAELGDKALKIDPTTDVQQHFDERRRVLPPAPVVPPVVFAGAPLAQALMHAGHPQVRLRAAVAVPRRNDGRNFEAIMDNLRVQLEHHRDIARNRRHRRHPH